MSQRAVLLSTVLVTAVACGGGGGGITQPPPVTTPPGASVSVVVYYDENGNGLMDANEQARLPQVEVTVGGRAARTETLSGRAVVQGVPNGVHAVAINPATLPPFYTAGASGATVTVPPDATATPIPLPARLEIGGNRRNVYMAFGDSITMGLGDSGAGGGYPLRLQAKLRAHFGDGEVVNRGADGTNSGEAVERVLRNIRPTQPAITLVMYGTNDWNNVGCQDAPPCDVVKNLRRVIDEVKAADSLPFLATIPPVNPVLAGSGRNLWVESTNTSLKQLAREEGAFVVDVYEAFRLQGGDVSRFFSDHVHPNAAGYDVMAEAFFQSIALGREAPRASSRTPALFRRTD